jgi:hypothetical protein
MTQRMSLLSGKHQADARIVLQIMSQTHPPTLLQLIIH